MPPSDETPGTIVTHGALIRAGGQWQDSRSCPVNPIVIRVTVFPYWFSFYAVFLSMPFVIKGDWIGINALCGLLLGLIILSQVLIENAVVSTQDFPRIIECKLPAIGLFLLNLITGALAGALTTFGLILVWNLLGPDDKSFSFEFGWREYVNWLIVALPTLIVALIVPFTGACLVVRRPETKDDVG